MKRLIFIIASLAVACTSPSFPAIDRPSTPTSQEDMAIIDYIDIRLEKEYFWLDEVLERSDDFNRRTNWEEYLDDALLMLDTNEDDGYINSKGQRVFYSYVREIDNDTRATSTTGFGIQLHYTIIGVGDERLGLVVEHVYEGSPAAKAGVRRGDIITTRNGSQIDMNNYVSTFNAIQNNTAATLEIGIFRQCPLEGESEVMTLSLDKGTYETTPIASCHVLRVESCDERIGYMAYTQFKSEHNSELVAMLQELASNDIDHFVLDLRTNGGGAVTAATKLVSAMLGSEYAGETLCELRRNPLNTSSETISKCSLEDLGFGLGAKSITIICSENTASASELVIEGLRGLDVPVTLIGTTTEGKNCGMDVTRRTISGKYIEYAPITFMCFNAKGFGDYGEGIAPDLDMVADNSWGVIDEYYPLPRCGWGDYTNDAALRVAIANITGSLPANATSTRGTASSGVEPYDTLARPYIGTTLLVEE